MNWIKCSDRLPEESRPEVLFYVDEYDQIELGKFNEATEMWMLPSRDLTWPAGCVSRWMPLPHPQTGYTLSQQERDALGGRLLEITNKCREGFLFPEDLDEIDSIAAKLRNGRG